MEKLKSHVEVHQLKDQGFGVAAIARKTNLSRNTVYSYLKKDFKEACEWVNEIKTRRRKLDPYQEQILNWLKEHPDLSSSQICDWLEERCSFKEIGESTVRTYVRELREVYHIPKSVIFRSYESVEELPVGKQMQVDFGEMKVKNAQGNMVKVYVIAFVLSHSRYKYAEWQDRPFTTRDVLRTHENAFEFYGGRTEEIVYDQDKLMTVSENGGDIIYTEEFQSYKEQRGFNVYLCRKSDPESKGKIENVVKFIKGNFAKNRVFYQIDKWNEQCIAWLERKGNYQVHNTIKKRPVEVFALEKPHLRKVSILLSFESDNINSITRMVHKDNIIKFNSNRYSVPLGTYKPKQENVVFVKVEGEKLIIRSTLEGAPIAVHSLCRGKGQLIKNSDHSRDRSNGIESYCDLIKGYFDEQEAIETFLKEIREKYPRYMRDQLQILHRAVKDYNPYIKEALMLCINKSLWSANEFHDVVEYLARNEQQQKESTMSNPSLNGVPTAHLKEKATLRELDGYIKILGGVQ